MTAEAPRSRYILSTLDELESEAIYVIREVAAQFERPVMLFSGGKDTTSTRRFATATGG